MSLARDARLGGPLLLDGLEIFDEDEEIATDDFLADRAAPDRWGWRCALRAVRTAGSKAASNTEAAALSAPSEARRMPNGACTCAKVVICCRPRKLVTVGWKKYQSSQVAS